MGETKLPDRLTPQQSKEILIAVEQGFDKQVEFTQQLMAYPSLRGQEHLAQEFLYQTLDDRGYEMDRWAIDVDEISSPVSYTHLTLPTKA